MQNTVPKQAVSFGDMWGLVGLAGLVLVLTALALWMLISQHNLTFWGGDQGQDPLATDKALIRFADETGIRIVRVSIIAGGGMIDLRYQVVDPDKAVVVHDDENPPGFIIEATGQVINTPYHDHSIFEAHHAITYHELIMNPAGVLKPGELITVMIGESRLEHVVVQ